MKRYSLVDTTPAYHLTLTRIASQNSKTSPGRGVEPGPTALVGSAGRCSSVKNSSAVPQMPGMTAHHMIQPQRRLSQEDCHELYIRG